jgi:hypothetical protein
LKSAHTTQSIYLELCIKRWRLDQRPDRLTAHPTVHSVSTKNQRKHETADSSSQCKPCPLSGRSRTTASLAVDERHAAAEMDGGHGLRQPMSPAISASAVVPQQRQMQLHHHPARPAIADLFTLYLGVSTSPVPNHPPSEGVLLAMTLGVCGLQINSKQRPEDPSRESS